MIYSSLEEFGNIVSELSVRGVVEPSQFGNAAHQFDETERDKVLKRRSVIREIAQHVIPNIDALRDGEIIPMTADQLDQAVGRH